MARALPIDRSGPLGQPLYLQLVERLRAEFVGQKPGARIDSEPTLARRFGVSRFTVTRAVEILVEEGLFTRRQGLGTFIAPPRLRRAPTYLASFTEAMAAQGRLAAHRLLKFGPAEETRPSSYPAGARLLRLDRLRLVDDVPTSIHRSLLDGAVAARIGLTETIAKDPHFSLYRQFREGGYTIERAVETLRARRATPKEARLLALDKDRVVVETRRETYASEGTLLDVDGAIYDARRYVYETEISRGLAPAAPLSKQKETTHASNSNDRRSFGPRIEPWRDDG